MKYRLLILLLSIKIVNAQHPWFNSCPNTDASKDSLWDKLTKSEYRNLLTKAQLKQNNITMDSIMDLGCSHWWYDNIWYRDTILWRDFKKIAKPYRDSGLEITSNLLYTPSQLSSSRIANLAENDSMTFYYFTWYTIKADWEAAQTRGRMSSYSLIKEEDAWFNGDLPDSLWQWYDSMGYNRVYFLRKLILKRTPCKWIIHASKDIFYTPDKVQLALDSFSLMMQDGKERFNFEYENTFAACLTQELLKEWNYPSDFFYPRKKQAHLISGSRYLNNWIWQYARIEIKDKQASRAVLFHKGKNKANRGYLTNNLLITFTDGTHKSFYLPFWFYIHKNYIRKWTPPPTK
jgi:hypothetical protein